MKSRKRSGFSFFDLRLSARICTSALILLSCPLLEAAEPADKGARLFGRIEQIAGEKDVQMPELKALSGIIDPGPVRAASQSQGATIYLGAASRNTSAAAGQASTNKTGATGGSSAAETIYSGKTALQFPEFFRGKWGGELEVWNYQTSPLYVQLDPREASENARILIKGRKGNVNFNFEKGRNGLIALEPAKVLLTYQSGSGRSSDDQDDYLIMYFGDMKTTASRKGVSGNEIRKQMYKNVIRSLSEDTIEQQILLKHTTLDRRSARERVGYEEHVLRFKRMSQHRAYVHAASVRYDQNGKFLEKLILHGGIVRGARVPDDPSELIN